MQVAGAGWTWGEGTSAVLDVRDAEVVVGDAIELSWPLTLPAYGAITVEWGLTTHDATLPFAGNRADPVAVPTLRGASDSLTRLVRQSVADLNALRLTERDDPIGPFSLRVRPGFLRCSDATR